MRAPGIVQGVADAIKVAVVWACRVQEGQQLALLLHEHLHRVLAVASAFVTTQTRYRYTSPFLVQVHLAK